jgi:hypothetical protein
MLVIHGGSPSGRAWLVDGRPDEVPGRFVGELVEVWRDFGALTLRLAEPLALRFPDVGFALEGKRAFGGDFCGDDESIGDMLGGVDGSSTASWLPALPSSGPADQPPPLPLRLLGSGESLSRNVEGTGNGLLFLTGIFDVPARVEYTE